MKVVYKRSLVQKENLTKGVEYSVVDFYIAEGRCLLGVDIPERIEFTVKGGNGKEVRLSSGNVDIDKFVEEYL